MIMLPLLTIIKCPPLRDHLAQCGLQNGPVFIVNSISCRSKVPNVPLTQCSQCSQYSQYSGGDYYGTNYPALVFIVIIVLITLTLSIFPPLIIGNTSITRDSAPLIQCEGGC